MSREGGTWTRASLPLTGPVAVECRVLGTARQPFYHRWLAYPATEAELAEE